MRRTTVLLAAAGLALAGCSSGSSEPVKTVTETVTGSPSLSTAAARAVCVDAWLEVLRETPDEAPDVADKPAVCEGLSGQAAMYAEALAARNAENRARMDECLEDPACTEFPVG